MTASHLLVLRRAGARALLVPALAGLVACGPGAAEIERGPVEVAAGESPAGLSEEAPAAEQGRLVLRGDVAYDGPATVQCGPAAPRGERPTAGTEGQAIGRLEMTGGGPRVGEEIETSVAHHAAPGFDLTLETAGLEVSLHLPDAGEDLEVPLVVALVGDDGNYRESPGRARVRLDDGSVLTRSAATAYVSARFSGSWDGEAGSGEVDGVVERCFYFD